MATDTGRFLMSIEECADRMQLNRSAVYKLVLTNQLRSCKIGRLRRISVRAVEEFIARQERRTVDPTTPPAA